MVRITNEAQKQFADFLEEQPHDFDVDISLTYEEQPPSEKALLDDYRHFLVRLNMLCFRQKFNRVMKRDLKQGVKIATVIETKNGLKHLHGTAVCPAHLSIDKFIMFMKLAWSKTKYGSSQQNRIRKMSYAYGWYVYMGKTLTPTQTKHFIVEHLTL